MEIKIVEENVIIVIVATAAVVVVLINFIIIITVVISTEKNNDFKISAEVVHEKSTQINNSRNIGTCHSCQCEYAL